MPVVLVIVIVLVWAFIELASAMAWNNDPKPIFALALLGAGIYWGVKTLKEQRRREAARRAEEQEEQADERRRRAHAARQRQLVESARSISASATARIENLAQNLTRAHEILEVAESEFRDRAYAPFWDAVERIINVLGEYDANVAQLGKYSQDYMKCVSEIESPPDEFRKPPARVFPHSSRATERMQAVLRKAQTDIDFATIYEQRRTNQLLIRGFGTLDAAIRDMSDHLESSIQELSASTQDGLRFVADRISVLGQHEHTPQRP